MVHWDGRIIQTKGYSYKRLYNLPILNYPLPKSLDLTCKVYSNLVTRRWWKSFQRCCEVTQNTCKSLPSAFNIRHHKLTLIHWLCGIWWMKQACRSGTYANVLWGLGSGITCNRVALWFLDSKHSVMRWLEEQLQWGMIYMEPESLGRDLNKKYASKLLLESRLQHLLFVFVTLRG